MVATDLAESYRAGMAGHLDHTVRVADPFHVVRVANRVVDKVRRRVQNETLGHRGRKGDPLYRIRKLLLTGSERLDERGHERMLLGLRRGDPHDELLGAWLAKESVRDVYLTERVGEARTLFRKAIVGCQGDEVPEIRSLGDTLERWSAEILNHHRTGASNGPTEGMNLCVKRIKRAGRGFSCFEHYRLRVLLHAGGVTGPGVRHRLGSEPALPTSTRRAGKPAGAFSEPRKTPDGGDTAHTHRLRVYPPRTVFDHTQPQALSKARNRDARGPLTNARLFQRFPGIQS